MAILIIIKKVIGTDGPWVWQNQALPVSAELHSKFKMFKTNKSSINVVNICSVHMSELTVGSVKFFVLARCSARLYPSVSCLK